MSGHRDDAQRRQEADAILTRLRQETEPQVGAQRMFTDARGHFMADDADPSDRIEVLGTRIGRLAGLVGFIVLAILFVTNHLLPG